MGALKLYQHDYRGFPTVQREDGYWDATALCAVKGKRLDNYLASPNTIEVLAALSRKTGLPVRQSDKLPGFQGVFSGGLFPDSPGKSLIEATEGRNGGTWVHRKVAIHLSAWLDADLHAQIIEWTDELLTTGRVELPKGVHPADTPATDPVLANLQALEGLVSRAVEAIAAARQAREGEIAGGDVSRRLAALEARVSADMGIPMTGQRRKVRRHAEPRFKDGELRDLVLTQLKASPQGIRGPDLADAIGAHEDSVRTSLHRLKMSGLAYKKGWRWFAVVQNPTTEPA